MRPYPSSFRCGSKPDALKELLGNGRRTAVICNAADFKPEPERTADYTAAHKLLWDGHEVPYWKWEEFEEPTPLALYKVVPEKFWMNDEGEEDGHYINMRREISL